MDSHYTTLEHKLALALSDAVEALELAEEHIGRSLALTSEAGGYGQLTDAEEKGLVRDAQDTRDVALSTLLRCQRAIETALHEAQARAETGATDDTATPGHDAITRA